MARARARAVVSESDNGVIGLYRGWLRVSESLVRPVAFPAQARCVPSLPSLTPSLSYATQLWRSPCTRRRVGVTLISIDNGVASVVHACTALVARFRIKAVGGSDKWNGSVCSQPTR